MHLIPSQECQQMRGNDEMLSPRHVYSTSRWFQKFHTQKNCRRTFDSRLLIDNFQVRSSELRWSNEDEKSNRWYILKGHTLQSIKSSMSELGLREQNVFSTGFSSQGEKTIFECWCGLKLINRSENVLCMVSDIKPLATASELISSECYLGVFNLPPI